MRLQLPAAARLHLPPAEQQHLPRTDRHAVRGVLGDLPGGRLRHDALLPGSQPALADGPRQAAAQQLRSATVGGEPPAGTTDPRRGGGGRSESASVRGWDQGDAPDGSYPRDRVLTNKRSPTCQQAGGGTRTIGNKSLAAQFENNKYLFSDCASD